MQYNNIDFYSDKVIIHGVKNFNIKQILECGQCFRWNKLSDNNYIIVAYNRVLEIFQDEDDVILYNTNEEEFNDIWYEYFDLGTDYDVIKLELSKDSILKQSVEYGYGIRILNQEPFEMLLSFIISARNSIPSIKRTINKISELWGDKLEYKGETYYSFPRPEQLIDVTEDDIRSTGASFRSKYLIDTIAQINHNPNRLKFISSLQDDECHKALQEFRGVGEKVADCIMLFSMKKTSAFPVDVWVKRAMMYFYNAEEGSLSKIRKFARDKFGDISGYAQQYLFYNARENKIKID